MGEVGNIGDQIVAMDPDGPNDALSYSLAGVDESSFELSGNQIRVRAGTMLNYETKDTYTVMVTAKDGSGQANDTASIVVTIMVVDEDEEPAITAAGLAVSGRRAVGYNENATTAVQIYSALGPDAGKAKWSVSGADGSYFSIKSNGGGELSFKNPPDYETPKDKDKNNVYMVTVVAKDGKNTAMMDVAVTVANLDEPGMITLNPVTPSLGSMITATLSDPDGATSDVVWAWQRSTNREIGWNSIAGANTGSYEPVAADSGHYLRAVATYTDPEGTGKRTEQATAGAVEIRPTFEGDTARTVPENSAMGTDVGAPVVATGGDSLNYRLGGSDAGAFDIDANGQITVASGAALDFETKASYSVTVTATNAAGASGEATVTITVENVEEPGTVTLSTDSPRSGAEIMATLVDDDIVDDATVVVWQWESSADSSDPWTPIDGGRL